MEVFNQRMSLFQALDITNAVDITKDKCSDFHDNLGQINDDT